MLDETQNNDEFAKNNDFGGAEQYNATGNYVQEQLIKLHKREKKADVISLVASLTLSTIPMAISAIKSKNSPTPYKPGAKDFARIGLFNILPIVKAIDTVFLNKKIQDTFDAKLPFKFNDVRNVVNIAYAYSPFHNIITNSFENSNRRARNEQAVPNSKYDVASAWLSGINLVMPYVVYKFTDDTMTFAQKCSSILPIGVIGGYVRKLAYSNPKTAQAYDITSSLVRAVSYGNNQLSNAVRSTNGSTINKASNQVGNIVNFASDLMGINRGGFQSNYGYGYGRNDGWNGGQRWGY